MKSRNLVEPVLAAALAVALSATLNLCSRASVYEPINLTAPVETAQLVEPLVIHIAAETTEDDGTEEPAEEAPTEEPAVEVDNLGSFTLTAYCSCTKCCGKWAKYNKTKSGATPAAGRTIAVDTRVIPLGTTVVIDGHEYIAEDTGSGVKGNHIDVYFNSHSAALEFGVQHKEVAIKHER